MASSLGNGRESTEYKEEEENFARTVQALSSSFSSVFPALAGWLAGWQVASQHSVPAGTTTTTLSTYAP